MRYVILAAGLFAALGLSACDKSKSDDATAAAPAAPAAPKYAGRSQQMYQGQEMVSSVDSATVKVGKAGTLEMQAAAHVDMPGYKNAGFLPRINAAAPKDGIYEVDVVADKPAPGASADTPLDVKGAWSSYPAEHLKGVKFISKTNSVVAMLPAG
ncbi:hypothetical protein [Phenylobacterium sp.]|uniref:hypothetical protein n=1 Tax=Phenylobacterium sp. TaxID=1871053 RepID=UPI001224892B|nr:hypothetical protein [Phenylobacterium sp.]THD58522.1 MAG: hypothetical protein E8A49_18520 [Phenylobacterium sp.]